MQRTALSASQWNETQSGIVWLKESCIDSKCEKNEQVTAPTAWGLLITIQSIQRENAKGRKESDSLSRIPSRILDAVQTICKWLKFSPNVLPSCEGPFFVSTSSQQRFLHLILLRLKSFRQREEEKIPSVNDEDWGEDRAVSASLKPHSVSNVVPPACEGRP